MSSSVLKDHKRVGKVLVPPFVHLLGPTRDVSWIKSIMPELCWIALINAAHGDRRAVEMITALARAARLAAQSPNQAFASCTSYASLVGPRAETVRTSLAQSGHLAPLQTALIPLVGNYDGCAMGFLYESAPARGDVAAVRSVLDAMFDRSERFSTMVQATAVWLMFDADILKVAEGLALASFPAIEDYPSTELSRKVGSGVRATLNMAFGDDGPLHAAPDWANSFWNQGLTMQPCEVPSD